MNTKNMVMIAVLLALTGTVGASERLSQLVGGKHAVKAAEKKSFTQSKTYRAEERAGEKIKKIKLVQGVPKLKYFHSTKKNVRWEILEKPGKGLQISLEAYEPKTKLKNRRGKELVSNAKLTLLASELGKYTFAIARKYVGADKKPKIKHYKVKVVKSMGTETVKKVRKPAVSKKVSEPEVSTKTNETLKDIARKFIEKKR